MQYEVWKIKIGISQTQYIYQISQKSHIELTYLQLDWPKDDSHDSFKHVFHDKFGIKLDQMLGKIQV